MPIRQAVEMIIVTLVVLFGISFLAGCANTTPAPVTVVRVVCPSLTPYSKMEQHDLSAELKQHPELVAVDRYLEDYASLRNQVRACRK